MSFVTYRTYLEVKPEFVFDFITDATRFPEYQVNLVEVKDISGKLDHIGASYTGVMKILGRRLEGHWEVTRFEKPMYLELKGTAPGGGLAKFINRLEPKGSGTDITWELTYEFPAGFLGAAFDKLFAEKAIERDMRHSGENFKAILESKVPVLV